MCLFQFRPGNLYQKITLCLMDKNKMKYSNIGSYERKRFKGRKKVNEIKDGFLILTEMIRLYFN